MERVVIKAIHSPAEHQDAIASIGRIMSLNAPDAADLAMLETLGILVERYEAQHFPLDKPTPAEAIRFRMDQMGINQTMLADLIGFPKSRISDVLNGKRTPSLEMIRALHEKLDIPSDILIGRSAATSS